MESIAVIFKRWFKGKDGRLWLEEGWSSSGEVKARDFCKNPVKATRAISNHVENTPRETARRLNKGEKIEYES